MKVNKDVLSKLTQVRVLALDLDGVVYLGNTPVSGAVEAIDRIRELDLKIYFVTNNSGKSREFIAGKLISMGIETRIEDILTSGYATGFLLHKLSSGQKRKIHVIGSEELKEEISLFGMKIVEDTICDFLVVGFDREFNYNKISIGLEALRQGAIFIACNRDPFFPVEDKRVLPGCGAMVAALEGAWGRNTHYEVGKPNTLLLEIISKKIGIKPSDILVVGDSLESDIAMANRYNAPSVFITNNKSMDWRKVAKGLKPSISLSTLKELPNIMRLVMS